MREWVEEGFTSRGWNIIVGASQPQPHSPQPFFFLAQYGWLLLYDHLQSCRLLHWVYPPFPDSYLSQYHGFLSANSLTDHRSSSSTSHRCIRSRNRDHGLCLCPAGTQLGWGPDERDPPGSNPHLKITKRTNRLSTIIYFKIYRSSSVTCDKSDIRRTFGMFSALGIHF